MGDKTCGWQDVDVLLKCVVDHTLKYASSVQPPPDVRDDEAFRVLRTAVCDVLQTYKGDYGNNECTQAAIIRISGLL